MKRALVTLALMGCCAGSTAHAAWTPTAVESVPIVADSTIAQDQPIVEVDGAGGVLVLWRDARTGVLRPAMQRLRFDGERFPGWPTDGLVLSTESAICLAGCREPPSEGEAPVPVPRSRSSSWRRRRLR